MRIQVLSPEFTSKCHRVHCTYTGEEGTGGSLGLVTSQAGLTDELQASENLSGKRWTPTAGPLSSYLEAWSRRMQRGQELEASLGDIVRLHLNTHLLSGP